MQYSSITFCIQLVSGLSQRTRVCGNGIGHSKNLGYTNAAPPPQQSLIHICREFPLERTQIVYHTHIQPSSGFYKHLCNRASHILYKLRRGGQARSTSRGGSILTYHISRAFFSLCGHVEQTIHKQYEGCVLVLLRSTTSTARPPRFFLAFLQSLQAPDAAALTLSGELRIQASLAAPLILSNFLQFMVRGLGIHGSHLVSLFRGCAHTSRFFILQLR